MTRNARLLMAFTLAQTAIPLLPVVVPFYKNQIGLSFQEFLICEAVFAICLVLMEVPSGWLSDMWKRKFVLVLAALIEGIAFIILAYAESLFMAMFAQGLIGVGVSFASGTIGAMLYDDLLAHDREGEFRRIEGKRHGFGFYTVGVSALAGGFLYEIDPYLPIWITALSVFAAIPIALMIKEPPRVKKAVERNPFYDAMQVAKFALRGHVEIAALIFFIAILYGTTQAGHWMQQPYYIALGIPEMLFGVFAATGFFIGGVGGHLGHVLEKWLRPTRILIGLWLTTILFLALSGAALWYHALFLLMISNAAFGIGWPVAQDAINKRIDSSRRATVLSVASLMIRLVFIPLAFIIGWVADYYGVQGGLLALAGFLFLANLWNMRKLV